LTSSDLTRDLRQNCGDVVDDLTPKSRRQRRPKIFLITPFSQPRKVWYEAGNSIRFHEVVAMARNVVQFQKGLSEPAFEQQYGSEEQCRAVVVASRWPNGFECPGCGGRQYSLVTTRDLYQCTSCRRQTSPIAGTIFASTHLPLRTWFRALYHLTQTKQGISSIELGRRLGVRQTTAWTIKHKLKQVMLERDASKRLAGRVEIDDAYIGGERSGGKRGRGAPGKRPFVAPVETTP